MSLLIKSIKNLSNSMKIAPLANVDQSQIQSWVNCWYKSDNLFQFIEHEQTPEVPEKSLVLYNLISRGQRLVDELLILNKERVLKEDEPLDYFLISSLNTTEELTWVEDIFDAGIFIDRNDLPLINVTLSALREIQRRLSSSIQHHYQLHLHPIEPDDLSYSESDDDEIEDRLYDQGHEEPLDLKEERHSPPMTPHASEDGRDLKGHDQEPDTSPNLKYRHGLYPLAHEVFDQWSPYLEDERLLDLIEQRCVAEEELIQQSYLGWRERVEELVSTERADQIWAEFIEPSLPEFVFESLKRDRREMLTRLICSKYTKLIDERRVRDSRLASLWFSGEEDQELTVIFLTREGRLLAQRDYVWDPSDDQNLMHALEEVKIRILVIPQELPPRLDLAIENLAHHYEMKRVSAVGLDPVPRPLNLTVQAQRALRLGQRYAAPLRYWARVEVNSFAERLLSPDLFNSFSADNGLQELDRKLKEETSIRWVYLRQNRIERAAHTEKQKRAKERATSISKVRLFRGDLLKVRVDEVETGALRFSVFDGAYFNPFPRGYISEVELKRANITYETISLGSVYDAWVVSVNPKTKRVSLSLTPRSVNQVQKTPRSSKERGTRVSTRSQKRSQPKPQRDEVQSSKTEAQLKTGVDILNSWFKADLIKK
jgi:hypothetical protein